MITEENKFNSKNTGILLITHGSRLPASSETINMLADMYRKETDFKVEVGYMEIHEPNIPDALDQLVKGTEIDVVIAVPVFLAHGMHTTRDIPKILRLTNDNTENDTHSHKHDDDNHNNDCAHSHHHDFEKINFNGKIIYTEPLGADPLVLEIIKNRVNSTIDELCQIL